MGKRIGGVVGARFGRWAVAVGGVVLVVVAERLHLMRIARKLPDELRTRLAQETRDIYAPLANRLGIWQY